MHIFNNVIFGQKTFIVNDHKEILVMKRQNNDIHVNLWDIPGGKVEYADKLSEAIKREVYEETGLKLDRILCILSGAKFIGSLDYKPTIFRYFYISKASGKVKLSNEHSEYKWIKVNELKDYNFIDDQDFQNALKILPKVLSTLDLNKEYCIIQ